MPAVLPVEPTLIPIFWPSPVVTDKMPVVGSYAVDDGTVEAEVAISSPFESKLSVAVAIVFAAAGDPELATFMVHWLVGAEVGVAGGVGVNVNVSVCGVPSWS